MCKTPEPDHRLCPACQSKAAYLQGKKYGFDILTCQNCGTSYVSRLPDCDSEQDYDHYYDSQNLATPDFVAQRLDEILVSFGPHRQNNRLLDVGFGAGDLLRAAVRSNWDAQGIEVSRSAVEYAQTLGLNVSHGELSEAGYPTDYFDVVASVEVLEHIPHPEALVLEIARILRPGGLFWATTPHGRGISARLLKLQWSVVAPPEHLQLLSHQGAKILLRKCGFQSFQVVSQGTNPYEILHTIRTRNSANTNSKTSNMSTNIGTFSRNESSYQLNEFLTSSTSRRAFKNSLNRILGVGRLGDSLKIRAVL